MRRGVRAFPRIIKTPHNIKGGLNKTVKDPPLTPLFSDHEVFEPIVKRTSSPFRIESQPLLKSAKFQLPISISRPFSATEPDLKVKLNLQEVVKPYWRVNIEKFSRQKGTGDAKCKQIKGKELNESGRRRETTFRFPNHQSLNLDSEPATSKVKVKSQTIFRFGPWSSQKPEETTFSFDGSRKKKDKPPTPDLCPGERKKISTPKPKPTKSRPKESPSKPTKKREKKCAYVGNPEVSWMKQESTSFAAEADTNIGDRKKEACDHSDFDKTPKDPIEEILKRFGAESLINHRKALEKSKQEVETLEQAKPKPGIVESQISKAREYLATKKYDIRAKQATKALSAESIKSHGLKYSAIPQAVTKSHIGKESTKSTEIRHNNFDSTPGLSDTDLKRKLKGSSRTQIDQGLLRKRKEPRKAVSTSKLTVRSSRHESQSASASKLADTVDLVKATPLFEKIKSAETSKQGSAKSQATSTSPTLGTDSLQYLKNLAHSKKGFVARELPFLPSKSNILSLKKVETEKKLTKKVKKEQESRQLKPGVKEEESVFPDLQTFLKDLQDICNSGASPGKDQSLLHIKASSKEPENKERKPVQLPKIDTGSLSEIITNTINDVKPLFQKMFEQIINPKNKK